MGSFWGGFGPFLGRSGSILGSLRDHFGIVSASFLGLFGAFLTHFWLFQGPFRAKTGHLGKVGSKKCIETLKHYVEEDT